MSESTEAPTTSTPPKPAKPLQVKISQKQHDSIAALLNQAAAIQAELQSKVSTIVEGSSKEIPPRAQLLGTIVNDPKVGPRKHYLVFAV